MLKFDDYIICLDPNPEPITEIEFSKPYDKNNIQYLKTFSKLFGRLTNFFFKLCTQNKNYYKPLQFQALNISGYYSN